MSVDNLERSNGPRSSLRYSLMIRFVPLAIVPLLVLAFLTNYLMERAIEQELQQRSVAEMASVTRNIDLLEKHLLRQLTSLSRDEEVVVALASGNRRLAQEVLTKKIGEGPFDLIQAYSFRGSMVGQKKREGQPKYWDGVFGSKGDSRKPAATRGGAFFAGDLKRLKSRGSLSEDFKRFIRREDQWVNRTLRAKSSFVVVSVFKHVVDSDFKTAGFLEAELNIDASILARLSPQPGSALLLFRPQFKGLLTASNQEIATESVKKTADLQKLNFEAPNPSLSLELDKTPYELFFSSLHDDGGTAIAWIGLALSKAEQRALQNQVVLWVGSMALLLALASFLIAIAIAKRVTQPISNLVAGFEAIQHGEWVQPISSDTQNEIGFLIARFNEMAQSVQITKRMLETKLEELAESHDALRQTQGQLVQSAKMSSLGQLVAGVAHELNNPIAFIYSNMSQMKVYSKSLDELGRQLDELLVNLPPTEAAKLRTKLDELEWDYLRKDVKDIVQSCLEGSIRVKDIVLGLKNFSRLDKGHTAEVSIGEMLRETVKLLSSQIKNRIQIEWDLASDDRLYCNPSQMNQVWMNLIANAAQAIDGKGKIYISLQHRKEKDEFEVVIRDNGKGIGAENIEKIFDPFFTTKKVGEGTGLGLSIVYSIIERHGGKISVQSNTHGSDRGTAFTIQLPRHAKLEGSSGASAA